MLRNPTQPPEYRYCSGGWSNIRESAGFMLVTRLKRVVMMVEYDGQVHGWYR